MYCVSEISHINKGIDELGTKYPTNFMHFLYKHKFKNIKNAHNYEEMHLMQRMYKRDNILLNYIMIDPTPLEKSTDFRNYLLAKRIHHDTIFKFVDFTFDLEICKVIYDGCRLYIKDIEALFERKCTIDLDLDKYVRRDFGGGGMSDDELTAKLRKRVEKYEQRGFKILLS